MYKTKLIFIIILLININYSNKLCGQEKFEKESRIKKKDAPIKAVQFIDSLYLKNKVKWYKEEGLNKKSIEAKFRHNKIKYSIEFDTLGNIEDVEKEINWKDLNENLKDSITIKLKNNCIKHKIIKVQIQYLGNNYDLFSKVKTDKNSTNLLTNYEIIVRCKSEKKVELFEYLFNETGKLLSISKIIFKNSSHLEY
jgi:hypothetical protein